MRIIRLAALGLMLTPLTACGTMQAYSQKLDAQHSVWVRNQKILDEQNQIQVNELQAKQRQQDIQKAKAEGQMEQAKAAGQAQAAIEAAKGEAQAILVKAQAQAQGNRLLAQSLTPLLVQDHSIEKFSDKSIIYLPSGTVPYMNLNTSGALPSQLKQ